MRPKAQCFWSHTIFTMKKLALFASGSGSNFQAIAEACQKGTIQAEIALLVCDNANAFVIERAKEFHIPTFTFNPKQYASKELFETEIVNRLQEAQVDVVCLAGYMRIVGPTLLKAYQGRMLNIHPSLLPSFKGAHAIDDAFNFGVKVFGVTVHLIDDTIDGGVILMQRAFEYYGTSRDEVEAEIHKIEHQLFPEAINRFLEQ